MILPMHALPSVLSVAVLASLLSAQAVVQFRDRVESGIATRHLVAADFDGDGDHDLMVGSVAGLYLLDNDGATGFARSIIRPGVLTNAMIGADVDGDGDVDIAMVTTSDVRLVRNLGGTYSDELLAPLAVPTTTMAWIDRDGDGDLDLVAAPLLADLLFLDNDGQGNFTVAAGVLPRILATQSIAVGDVDGDGRDDMMVAGQQGRHLFVGSPSGFVDRSSQIAGLPAVSRPVFADVDGDGDRDLIGLIQLGGTRLAVFFNDGSGGFSAAGAPPSVPTTATDLTLADLDEDGDLDIVATSTSGTLPLVYLYENDGAGRFVDATAVRYGHVDGSATGAVTADFDGDGDVDVYVGASVLGILAEDDRLLINRAVDLEVPAEVMAGGQLRIDCAREPGYGTGLHLALVAVGVEAGPVATPFGAVHIDPGARALPVIVLPMPGEGQLFEPVPNDPGLIGLEFAVQGIIVELFGASPPRLTGFAKVRVR